MNEKENNVLKMFAETRTRLQDAVHVVQNNVDAWTAYRFEDGTMDNWILHDTYSSVDQKQGQSTHVVIFKRKINN